MFLLKRRSRQTIITQKRTPIYNKEKQVSDSLPTHHLLPPSYTGNTIYGLLRRKRWPSAPQQLAFYGVKDRIWQRARQTH